MKIELNIWRECGDTEVNISGFYGSFGSFNAVGIAQLLGSETPHIPTEIYKALGDDKSGSWTVNAEVVYVEPETQYGTGYGDVLTLSGYYHIGKLIEVVKHKEIDSTEYVYEFYYNDFEDGNKEKSRCHTYRSRKA